MTTTRRNRSGAKTLERREEIVRAAAQLFFEKGYDVTSIKDIADAAGLLKGSLYYYVDSKEDFLFEIIKQSHEGARELLERVRMFEGDPLQRLAVLIAEHLRFHTSNLVNTTIYFREFRVLSPERRRTIQADGDRYLDFVGELLHDGQQKGLISDAVDVRVVAIGLVGLLNSAWLWYQPGGSRSSSELAGEFARIMLSGIASDTKLMEAGGAERFREAVRVAAFSAVETTGSVKANGRAK